MDTISVLRRLFKWEDNKKHYDKDRRRADGRMHYKEGARSKIQNIQSDNSNGTQSKMINNLPCLFCLPQDLVDSLAGKWTCRKSQTYTHNRDFGVTEPIVKRLSWVTILKQKCFNFFLFWDESFVLLTGHFTKSLSAKLVAADWWQLNLSPSWSEVALYYSCLSSGPE